MSNFVSNIKWHLRPANILFQTIKDTPWYYLEASRLRRFKDKHKGEDCFIIGNGPSLNKMDLEPLKDYHTFGLNKIYLMFEKVDLNLSYLVSVNELVIEQSQRQFKEMYCPTFLAYEHSRNVKAKHIFKIKGGERWSFSRDITTPITYGNTVTYVAMQLAYYMGFENIFLIGVDHSFKQAKGKENQMEVMEGEDENHFHPDYFKGMKWHLADLDGSEVSYTIARFVFERFRGKIWDATKGGKLEIFTKIPYETALQMCKKK